MDKKYTIKSISEEGAYYLVNGWNKYKKFWISEDDVKKDREKAMSMFFSAPRYANSSLKKLLSVMEDYRNDKFELVEFE